MIPKRHAQRATTAQVTIQTDQPKGPPIRRALFGKFTEHLGRNVYGGAWAETVENPWFATLSQWPKEEVVRQRLDQSGEQFQLPDLAGAPDRGLAPYWLPLGKARFGRARGLRGPAQGVAVDSTGAGLRTLVFLPLPRQNRYRLALRGRASQTTTLVARLITLQEKELGRGTLTLRPGQWQIVRRTFHLENHQNLAPGTPLLLELQIDCPATVWLDRCSLVPADHRHGWDRAVIAWMKAAQLPLLRFPGGNFASGYHWQDGVGPLDSRPILPNPAWPEIEWNEVGTDDWLGLCELVGCEALICVNAGNGTPEEAARWVEYCNGSLDTPMGALRATNGHPQPYGVKRWEIGNELYGTWQIGHSSARDYGRRYQTFRKAMLAADPTIDIIANGHDGGWNQTVMETAGSTIRSLSVHTLVGRHIPAEADPKTVFREYMGFAAAYGDHLKALAAPMKKAGLTPKLAITELSIFTLKPQLPNVDNLSEALYYSGIVNAAIKSEGLVELITHSALINHSAGLVKQRGVVYPHPFWWALHLYSTQPGVQPLAIQVASPTFSCSGKWLSRVPEVPVLDGVALMSEDRNTLTVFLSNRDPEDPLDLQLTVTGLSGRVRGTLWTLTGDSFMATNRWNQPDRVRPVRQSVSLVDGGLNHRLPPHSLTRLTLRAY